MNQSFASIADLSAELQRPPSFGWEEKSRYARAGFALGFFLVGNIEILSGSRAWIGLWLTLQFIIFYAVWSALSRSEAAMWYFHRRSTVANVNWTVDFAPILRSLAISAPLGGFMAFCFGGLINWAEWGIQLSVGYRLIVLGLVLLACLGWSLALGRPPVGQQVVVGEDAALLIAHLPQTVGSFEIGLDTNAFRKAFVFRKQGDHLVEIDWRNDAKINLHHGEITVLNLAIVENGLGPLKTATNLFSCEGSFSIQIVRSLNGGIPAAPLLQFVINFFANRRLDVMLQSSLDQALIEYAKVDEAAVMKMESSLALAELGNFVSHARDFRPKYMTSGALLYLNHYEQNIADIDAMNKLLHDYGELWSKVVAPITRDDKIVLLQQKFQEKLNLAVISDISRKEYEQAARIMLSCVRFVFYLEGAKIGLTGYGKRCEELINSVPKEWNKKGPAARKEYHDKLQEERLRIQARVDGMIDRLDPIWVGTTEAGRLLMAKLMMISSHEDPRLMAQEFAQLDMGSARGGQERAASASTESEPGEAT